MSNGTRNFLQGLLAAAALCAASAHAEAPSWYHESLIKLQPDDGLWIADNSAYQSADEPFDAYGLEWRWGLGRKSVTGRLFGLIDGEEQATFWEFRLFWHAGDNRAVLQQFGVSGVFGTGALWPAGVDREFVKQRFYAPDGTVWDSVHETRFKPGEQVGISYDVAEDGAWVPRREYVWTFTSRETDE